MREIPDIVEAWRRHCASFKVLEFGDGTVIHRQGHTYRHVYCVGAGYLKREALVENGMAFIRALLSRGDFFGALADGVSRPALDSIVCKGGVRLYRCGARECQGLIENHPSAAQALLGNLESQLAFAWRQTDAILHSPVESRVARILHELAGRHGGACRHGHELDIRLTQQEMAELVGASRPVVSTVLNDLRRRRIIGYTRAFICIEDMEALRGTLARQC